MSAVATAPAQPTVRARSRPAPSTRQLDVGPETKAPLERAAELANEALDLNKSANALISAHKTKVKELALFCSENGVGNFEVTFGVDKYDVGEIAETTQEVDIALLRKELADDAEFLKVVKATQGDVKSHGGDTLLNKVLRAVTKPAEFKIKKQKKG